MTKTGEKRAKVLLLPASEKFHLNQISILKLPLVDGTQRLNSLRNGVKGEIGICLSVLM